MNVVTICQRKGGNGKSTAVINLAYAYARLYGHKVLVIDADDQRNTTSTIPTKRPVTKTLESLLLEHGAAVEDVAEPTAWHNIDIVAGNPGLSSAASALDSLPDGHDTLRCKIRGSEYDLCLIDTSPSLNMLTINAMCASDGLIIPLSSNYFSLQGLAQTMDAYRKLRSDVRKNLQLFGIAFVIHDGRTRLANEVHEKVQEQYPDVLCETVISRNIKIEEAQVCKQSIFTYAPKDRGVLQYRLLAEELAIRMRML